MSRSLSPRPAQQMVQRGVRSVLGIIVSATLAATPLIAAPEVRAAPASQVGAVDLTPNPDPLNARITIDELSPTALGTKAREGAPVAGTESGVPTVTVSGTVRNVGDTPITDVVVRLQRGPRVADPESVREPLNWSEPSFSVHGQFQQVTSTLGPGESIRYRVSMPAWAVPGGGEDLQITERGVYPLLVNVNGTPEGAGSARLDDARTLLPVLQVPAPPGSESGPAGPFGASPAGEPAQPSPPAVPFTLILPLAVPPSRVAHIPGSDRPESVVSLSDNSLPRALAPEGRLTGLLNAAERAFAAPGGEELRRATCLAVDPSLLDTVNELAGGQKVAIGSDNAEASGDIGVLASEWLGQLKALAADTCVIPLPADQADLDAVVQVGDPGLTGLALDRKNTVRQVLGVDALPNVVVPAGGTLAPETAPELRSVPGGGGSTSEPAALTAVVAASSTRSDTGLVPAPGLVEIAGQPGLRALTYSTALGSALAATGDAPENPRYSRPSSRFYLEASSPAARLQDARAALLAPLAYSTPQSQLPSSTVTQPGSLGTDSTSNTVPPEQGILAVPPAVWGVDSSGAASLLGEMADLFSARQLSVVPLADRLSAPITVPAGSLAEDPSGGADPGAIDPQLPLDLRGPLAGLAILRQLVDTPDPRSASASGYLDPIAGDALRILSTTGRRAGGDGITLNDDTGQAARARASTRFAGLETTVRDALSRVDLLPPGSVFTMASPNSPLLLVTRNQLPFPVRVNIDVSAPPGLRVDPLVGVQVPAFGSRTVQLSTANSDDSSGRRTVSFTLRGPENQALSAPVTLSVQSGGYPLAVFFTLTAAALALVLGGRRFLRYRRGTPDPADEGHRP